MSDRNNHIRFSHFLQNIEGNAKSAPPRAGGLEELFSSAKSCGLVDVVTQSTPKTSRNPRPRTVKRATITPLGKEFNKTLRYSITGRKELLCYDEILLDEQGVVQSLLYSYANEMQELSNAVESFFGGIHTRPHRIHSLQDCAENLAQGTIFNIRDIDFVAETVALACRTKLLELREHREKIRPVARDPEVLEEVTNRIQLLSDILRRSDIRRHSGKTTPHLGEYINIGALQERFNWGVAPETTPRLADEKFSILSSPRMYASDYKWSMRQAGMRGRSLAVAYIDIDNFKEFNTKHTEKIVDSKFLPYFMRGIEAFCFGRSFAYREGGDEYIVLLPNTSKPEASAFFGEMQSFLKSISYPDGIATPTVSVGIHLVAPSQEISGEEAQVLANCAKAWAKHEGALRKEKGMITFSTTKSLDTIISGGEPELPPITPREISAASGADNA